MALEFSLIKKQSYANKKAGTRLIVAETTMQLSYYALATLHVKITHLATPSLRPPTYALANQSWPSQTEENSQLL